METTELDTTDYIHSCWILGRGGQTQVRLASSLPLVPRGRKRLRKVPLWLARELVGFYFYSFKWLSQHIRGPQGFSILSPWKQSLSPAQLHQLSLGLSWEPWAVQGQGVGCSRRTLDPSPRFCSSLNPVLGWLLVLGRVTAIYWMLKVLPVLCWASSISITESMLGASPSLVLTWQIRKRAWLSKAGGRRCGIVESMWVHIPAVSVCDLAQGTRPLWASVSPSVKWV